MENGIASTFEVGTHAERLTLKDLKVEHWRSYHRWSREAPQGIIEIGTEKLGWHLLHPTPRKMDDYEGGGNKRK